MLRKCLKDVEVNIKISESKKCYKMLVDNDIRLKTLANKLCTMNGLDPYRTEWAFYNDDDQPHEIPITYTLNQCKFHGDRYHLIGKIVTTTMKENFYVEVDAGRRFFSNVYGKTEIHNKSIGIQTENAKMSKTMQPRFSVEGIVREQRIKESPLPIRDFSNIWENLKRIEQNRILRGFNLVGYCPNKKCLNFNRWICIGLGYGRFSNKKVKEIARCELCPRKDMFKKDYCIVGVFFKECQWNVEKCRQAQPGANPPSLEKWRGKEILSVEIQKFYVYDTIFDGVDKDVEVKVVPLCRGDQESIFYKNPNISAANRIY